LLVRSPLIEGNQVDWLRDPEKRSYLLAPFHFYPLDGVVIALPRDFSPGGRLTYLDEVAGEVLGIGTRRILLMGFDLPEFAAALERKFAPAGYRPRPAGRFGGLSLMIFEK